MDKSIHKDTYVSVKQRDLRLSVRSGDIYALIIPDSLLFRYILDNCRLGALDEVFISDLDDLHFNDIYRGET